MLDHGTTGLTAHLCQPITTGIELPGLKIQMRTKDNASDLGAGKKPALQ
jgi:hypothetical protein